MREACIAAVQTALQRDLQPGEARGIESRIRLHMNLLARRGGDEWRSLSGSQRLNAAAEAAARALVSDIAKSKQRIALMVPVFDRIESALNASGMKPTDRLRTISRLLAADPGTRTGAPMSIESSAIAQEKMALGAMRKTLLATNPKVMGLFENAAGMRDLMREIYGEHTGNATAAEGAKLWKKYADEARDRFNAAGGDIGKLGEHYFPQHHDPYLVGNAKLQPWLAKLVPLLDRDKYLENDGTRMTDARVREFLTHAFDSIINDGKPSYQDMKLQPDMLNKDMFGKNSFGYGLFADRNAQHRQIFFKDADSFMAYQSEFGGHSLYSMLEQHVRRMARDTAVLERLGPYADQAFAFFNEREARAARQANSDKAKSIDHAEAFNQLLFNEVSGRTANTPTAVSNFMQGFRNVLTGLRLEKVVITAMGDEAGMFATAFANKVPYGRVLLREAQLLTPLTNREHRERLEGAGLGLQSMLGSLNRFGGELYGHGWTGRFANAMMRVSGAERMWDTRRQAIGAELMYKVGQVSRRVEKVDNLSLEHHGVLARKGITQSAWDTMRASELDGDGRITPETINQIPDEKLGANATALKRDAATQLMAHVLEEAGMGVMDTGARQRAQLGQATGGATATSTGKSLLLFKTFATSVMLKHWARMASMGTLGSKAGYLSALALYGTAIAATMNGVRALLAGQELPDYSSGKTWMSAVLRGGGLGYFGDFLYDAENSNGNTFIESLGGPVATAGSDLWNVTGAAAVKAQKGERTDEAGNLVRLARNNTPFTQLWYASAVFDHLLWNAIQEEANPGYLDRLEERQAKFGRQYWWHPNETLPHAGPDPYKAIGGSQ